MYYQTNIPYTPHVWYICATNCVDGNWNKALSYTQYDAEVQHLFCCVRCCDIKWKFRTYSYNITFKSTVVTTCTTFALKKPLYLAHSAFVGFVWFSEQTASISLIDRLVFVMKTQCGFCEVGMDVFKLFKWTSCFKALNVEKHYWLLQLRFLKIVIQYWARVGSIPSRTARPPSAYKDVPSSFLPNVAAELLALLFHIQEVRVQISDLRPTIPTEEFRRFTKSLKTNAELVPYTWLRLLPSTQ
jgi:hypothetical protein